MTIQILSIIISAAVALVTGMVLLYLRTISQQSVSQNTRIDAIENDQKEAAKRKDQCRQDFVDKVDYIREVTKLESTQTEMLKVLSEIKGSLTVIEKLPEICGNIASEVVKEMKQLEAQKNV